MPTQENNLSNVISDEEKTHDVIDNDIENNNPQKTKKSSGFWLLIILILLLTAMFQKNNLLSLVFELPTILARMVE